MAATAFAVSIRHPAPPATTGPQQAPTCTSGSRGRPPVRGPSSWSSAWRSRPEGRARRRPDGRGTARTGIKVRREYPIFRVKFDGWRDQLQLGEEARLVCPTMHGLESLQQLTDVARNCSDRSCMSDAPSDGAAGETTISRSTQTGDPCHFSPYLALVRILAPLFAQPALPPTHLHRAQACHPSLVPMLGGRQR